MSKKVAEFYDDYTVHQLKSGINLRHRRIQSWAKKFGLKEHHTILEIGCGIGTVTGLLAEIIKSGKILANDISPKSIEIAKTRLQKFNQIDYMSGDIVELDIKDKFDFIVLPDVLEHIPIELHSKLFSKLKTLVKDSGAIIIHIPAPNCLAWDAEHNPEILQIIDQPIYTNILSQNVYSSGLYIYYLEIYSIWRMDDYQVIVIKPNDQNFNFPTIFKATFLWKAKYKLKNLLRSK
jgi:trans-aconitate 2-methyltransferase